MYSLGFLRINYLAKSNRSRPKKNGKIGDCVDYRKLNAAMVTDAFPLPFTDRVLDAVASQEIYSFLDGFIGYNQVRMHPDDQEKTAFVIEWGLFIAVVMMFGLKTAPATFQRVIREIFGDYIPAFMQVFLDDFAITVESRNTSNIYDYVWNAVGKFGLV